MKKTNLQEELFTAIRNLDSTQITNLHKKDRTLLSGARDKDGNTTLHMVCEAKNHAQAYEIMKVMFPSHKKAGAFEKRKAFINHQNSSGDTALIKLADHEQSSESLLAMVRLLRENGAEINIINNFGNNIAHCAALRGNTGLLELLLPSHKSELQDSILLQTNASQMTALDILKDVNPEKFIEFVTAHELWDVCDRESIFVPEIKKVEVYEGDDTPPPLVFDIPTLQTNQIIDEGRKLEESKRAAFVLEHSSDLEELSILFFDWFNCDIRDNEVASVISRINEIASADQYFMSWAVGYKPTITFNHLEQAAKKHVEERERMTALILEIETLKEKIGTEKIDFVKKHASENKLLAKCFESWYGVEKTTEEIARIMPQLAAQATSKMSWGSYLGGYGPELNEVDLMQMLGCQMVVSENVAE
jgi:hypothetical protein